MEKLEEADIQGYIVRGYKHMMFSRYVLLHVTDAAAAKGFVRDISGSITNVTHYPKSNCLNIAFTAAGLRALGMNEANLNNFSREFTEGMTTPHRQRIWRIVTAVRRISGGGAALARMRCMCC